MCLNLTIIIIIIIDNNNLIISIAQIHKKRLIARYNIQKNGKWFEPRSLSRLCGLIVRVRVVPRTVVGDVDRRFDNLSGSHHQSHVNCVSSVYGIYISGQLSRDVLG